MIDPGRVLIVGAGPTGLGAAWRLAELGFDDFLLLEASDGVGGLATSDLDPQGFTWDVGGHVQFSHYGYYDDVLDLVLGNAWLEHERESWIRVLGSWVPYPFQNNIHRLPDLERARALAGLESAAARTPESPPKNFRDWILVTFGSGIADLFMLPYNAKVWGYPLEEIGVGWMGERVASPDLARIRRNVAELRDDVSWGPNNRFRFPATGGTGAIWRAVAARLGGNRLRLGAEVADVDARAHRVALASGERLSFDALVSTMPLDSLCARTSGLDPELASLASRLRHSSVHVLGFGFDGPRSKDLARKCWMYFPEERFPFYRVTVFSNYSPANVPAGEGYWSLMAETCEVPGRPVDARTLWSDALEALRREGLVPAATRVVSRWHRREEHGYPTPFLGRDAVVHPLRRGLEQARIFSRGRFGAWTYEVANQDHSFMQGVEVVDRLLGLGDEPTLRDPSRANRGTAPRPERISRS